MVKGLGSGLTSESADAIRVVLLTICRPDPGFGTHRRCRSDLPGLGKRPGFTGPGGQRVRAIPQPQKGMTLTIVETRAVTGGVDTHADTHVAAALDPVGGLLGVRGFPATAAGYSGLLGWLGRVRARWPGGRRGARAAPPRPPPPRGSPRAPGA